MKHERSAGKMMVIVIAVSLVVVLAGVAIVAKTSLGSKSKTKEKKHVPTVEMPLGEFVVNLADTGTVRYLKTDVVLSVAGEMKSEGGGHGEEEASGPNAKIRDAVIEVLSSKHFEELVKPDGKDVLKKDIIESVNKRLDGAEVVEVYFNEFAMQ